MWALWPMRFVLHSASTACWSGCNSRKRLGKALLRVRVFLLPLLGTVEGLLREHVPKGPGAAAAPAPEGKKRRVTLQSSRNSNKGHAEHVDAGRATTLMPRGVRPTKRCRRTRLKTATAGKQSISLLLARVTGNPSQGPVSSCCTLKKRDAHDGNFAWRGHKTKPPHARYV